jgi:hypothetical protein
MAYILIQQENSVRLFQGEVELASSMREVLLCGDVEGISPKPINADELKQLLMTQHGFTASRAEDAIRRANQVQARVMVYLEEDGQGL